MAARTLTLAAQMLSLVACSASSPPLEAGGNGSVDGASTGGNGGAGVAELVIYPDPPNLDQATNLSQSDLYSVKVNGQASFVYRSVNRQPEFSAIKEAHFTYFSFDAHPVTIEVTKLTGDIASIEARPSSLSISPQVAGSRATFVLPSPKKLLLQIDGDSRPLIILADKPDIDIPTGPNVKRFGPGYHVIGRNYELSDNQTVYIDGGAVVEGTFGADTSMRNNVTLRGRGIVYAGDYAWPGDDSTTYGKHGLFHQNVKNSRIEGIIALDSEYWTFGIANENTVFENLKLIGWEKNTDGIWFGPDSVVRDCFIMTNDDSIRPVSSPTYPDGSTTLLEDLVIWHQGYGRPLYLPVQGGNAPYVQNITYRNIVFIRSELSHRAQSYIPMTSGPSNRAKVRNLLFENITFEEIRSPTGTPNQGNFFIWEVSSGSSISNITFRNVHTPVTKGSLTGLSSTESISNVTFDGVHRDGQKMTSLAQMGLTTNEYVNGVEFR